MTFLFFCYIMFYHVTHEQFKLFYHNISTISPGNMFVVSCLWSHFTHSQSRLYIYGNSFSRFHLTDILTKQWQSEALHPMFPLRVFKPVRPCMSLVWHDFFHQALFFISSPVFHLLWLTFLLSVCITTVLFGSFEELRNSLDLLLAIRFWTVSHFPWFSCLFRLVPVYCKHARFSAQPQCSSHSVSNTHSMKEVRHIYNTFLVHTSTILSFMK